MFLSPLTCDLGRDLQPPEAANGDWSSSLYDGVVPALAGRSFLLVVLSWLDQVPDGVLRGRRRTGGGPPDLLPPLLAVSPPHCPVCPAPGWRSLPPPHLPQRPGLPGPEDDRLAAEVAGPSVAPGTRLQLPSVQEQLPASQSGTDGHTETLG